MYDDVYFNLNDAQYKVLNPNSGSANDNKLNLMPIRVWQGQTDDVGNYFIEPDYHMDILGVGDAVSVPLDGGGKPKMSGSPGQEYYAIEGVSGKTGVAVLRVTYDPEVWNTHTSTLVTGDLNIPASDKYMYFNATEPRLTGIAVMNVTDVNSSALSSDIGQREYDTIYFDKEAGHGTYTFKPSVADSPGAPISVRVHKPVHEGGGYEFFSAEAGDPGWESGTKDAGGNFTINLYDGRNIVEVKSGSMVQYHVVTALALKVKKENISRPGQAFKSGDSVKVSFEGMRLAPAKIAGIYNPGYPNGNRVVYSASDGREFRSPGIQYTISNPLYNAVTVPLTETGALTLTGVNSCNYLGSTIGAHRIQVPNTVGIGLNMSAPDTGPTVWGIMPEIVLRTSHTVTFDAGGGSAVAPEAVGYGLKAAKPADPTRNEHTFAGWYKDAEYQTPWDFENDTVTGDATLYAKWTSNNVRVTFDAQGGSAVATQTVPRGTAASEPAAPAKPGHTFEGWYKEVGGAGEWNFSTAVSEDITLYAYWTNDDENMRTVTFNTRGGTGVSPKDVLRGRTFAKPDNPTKPGYRFTGWERENGVEWNFAGDVVTENVTLYAKWERYSVTVAFDAMGGSPAPQSQEVTVGEPVARPVPDPAKSGCRFDGWYKDGVIWDFNTTASEEMMRGGITLYAKWTESRPSGLTETPVGVTDGLRPGVVPVSQTNGGGARRCTRWTAKRYTERRPDGGPADARVRPGGPVGRVLHGDRPQRKPAGSGRRNQLRRGLSRSHSG